jgi:hypothetical protein
MSLGSHTHNEIGSLKFNKSYDDILDALIDWTKVNKAADIGPEKEFAEMEI